MPLWLEFREALRKPEYVHVLLNPLPVYGLAIGILAWLISWATRRHHDQGLALALILLAGLSAWPVAHFGAAGYDRVTSMSGAEAQKWLNWHRHLANRAVWACYAAAAFSAAGLGTLWKRPRLYRLAAGLSLASALLALGLGGVAAFAGGKIRHSEFRSDPPPAWADTSAEMDK
jgi:hypothetical protein